ncbi:hypothetical protein [Magnetospirillum aberrantis]|uniref:Uncharacterized protein n=1 Tax=Magnetospirillum aberrantis SpK TaxID=908842 RepID=A0A7C9QRW7_9PROT|nr:hypothetical protein [Magnetospirillum aberrantis]NFV79043.1 hypothetical protein [Magnetospirillum aberrantis SpK]
MDDSESRSRAKRFADYVRLHVANEKAITLPVEARLLRSGINDFGLDLDLAQGTLMAVATREGVALESLAERPTRTFIDYLTNGKKVSKKNFRKAVTFYRRLTNDAVDEETARKQVKRIVDGDGLKVRRNLIGMRRWYNRIPKPDPVA